MNPFIKTTGAIALFSLLAACGGGDDKDSSSSPSTGDPGTATATATATGTGTGAGTGAGTGTGMTGFAFRTDPPASYTRVDRFGMPAVATAVITNKDAYNAANPTDDAAFTFATEITANVTALHGALDDDLTGLGLTPCLPADCVSVAATLVIPDAISIDVNQAAGFPNGRQLTDPVIDVTLAVVLLDLSVHGATDLVGVNPTANDVAFQGSFPWLAAAW